MLSFLQKSPAKSVEVAKEFDETLDWKLQIFDIIKDIRDPEKPETLEELSVVQEDLVDVCESIEKLANQKLCISLFILNARPLHNYHILVKIRCV